MLPSEEEKMSRASIGDVLEHPWPRSLAVKLKKETHVGCWRWSMFPLKDRNSGEQWLVQRGSVTLHANDRSAAGSAGSPPQRCTLVCSRSKADPTHWDRPTLTDWQGKHAPPLSCCTLSDWLGSGGAGGEGGSRHTSRRTHQHEPTHSWKAPKKSCAEVLFQLMLDCLRV